MTEIPGVSCRLRILVYTISMNIEFTRVTWYSQVLAIILATLIFALGFYAGSLARDTDTPAPISDTTPKVSTSNDLSTQKINACDKEFVVNTVFIEGVNIAMRMAELVNKEVADEPSHSVCYWVKQNLPNLDQQNLTVGSIIVHDKPLDGEDVYDVGFLGTAFLVDKKTYEVYVVNEMDGSPGKIIGKLK